MNTSNQESNIYTCPMHLEVRQDKPGRCPECGMTLVKTQSAKRKTQNRTPRGHDKHEGHSLQMFMRKFWISLVLTIPVVLYSELPQRLLGWQPAQFVGSQYLSLVLGSVVFFYGGWVFLAGAWRELQAKLPGMMTLIGIAVTAAYLFSVFETLRGSPHTLFWELTSLITIMLLGHYLEMRAVQGAQGALKELAKLLPDEVEVIRGENTEIVPLAQLKEDDLVLVKPGGKIPADGEIIEGGSDVNESLLTGESRPVAKSIGDKVIAGAINGDGSLKVKVAQIGKKTFLAGVMRLVSEAQASKSRLQILSDRAAFYLTVIALIAGGITFVSWLLADKGIITATERLVAVLVVACPHALGLAVPLVASISTTMAARKGFLVKQRLALEAARSVEMVLFDKTGTLTKGEFGVDTIVPAEVHSKEEVLIYAASVNSHSEHPIAKALVREAKSKKLELRDAQNFQRLPGKGAKAQIQGVEVSVGSQTLIEELNLNPGEGIQKQLSPLAKQGKTIIYAVAHGEIVGAIALADVIREESREAINTLKGLGLKTAMITGDSEDVATWVAKELGIDFYYARVLPSEKSDIVRQIQEGKFGHADRPIKVAMVGDGVNDAPALTLADLGIAIGAGTNIAIESAGIILVKNDPRDIAKIVKLSQLTYKKMIQNLFWATGYNAIALPLAAGVLASRGVILQPALAAMFMSLSTVIVAVNALLLKRQKLD